MIGQIIGSLLFGALSACFAVMAVMWDAMKGIDPDIDISPRTGRRIKHMRPKAAITAVGFAAWCAAFWPLTASGSAERGALLAIGGILILFPLAWSRLSSR